MVEGRGVKQEHTLIRFSFRKITQIAGGDGLGLVSQQAFRYDIIMAWTQVIAEKLVRSS